MEEYEKLIEDRFQNKILPKNIILDYIKKAKEKGIILDDELVEIPLNLTLDGLKKKLMEYRRQFFKSSLDSFNCDLELEEINQSEINKENNIPRNKQTQQKMINGNENKVISLDLDEKEKMEKKERRLKNVLSAYYEYEMAKIKEEKKEPQKGFSIPRIRIFITLVLFLFGLILFIDYLDILRPF